MNLQPGAKQAVKLVSLKKDEDVVIITDKETESIGKAIVNECSKITKNIVVYVMEELGIRPLHFSHSLSKVFEKADVSFYCATGKPGELQTFRMPMNMLVHENKIRHAHMINVNERMMVEGMVVDYSKVKELSKKVYNLVVKAKKIEVTNEVGTNFTVTFNPKIKWIISDGTITKEKWSNLPDGEVWTAPQSLNGDVVVDGVIGDYFSAKYGLLKDFVHMRIENSRVVKLFCDNKNITKDLKEYMKQDENANRVGEFAIGTNIGLKGLIGNLLQDEKFPGVHIAVGDAYHEKTGATWKSKAHCDFVLQKTTILIDGKKIMDKGKFLI
tara:strand:+ start:4359 stop:5339 length:981 start_codon:yes stop_codon:yes gene_type:complete